jgi:hypothetical protein
MLQGPMHKTPEAVEVFSKPVGLIHYLRVETGRYSNRVNNLCAFAPKIFFLALSASPGRSTAF